MKNGRFSGEIRLQRRVSYGNPGLARGEVTSELVAGALALVAMHPDEATDAVVDAALEARKPFAAPRRHVSSGFPCDFHRFFCFFSWFFARILMVLHGFRMVSVGF